MTTLNASQQLVAGHRDGNLRVAAVAGAGKTTAILQLIADITRAGQDPTRVLATTFSKRAAVEMQDRLKKVAPGCRAKIGTLHSVCLQILREGSPWADFEIADDGWDRVTMKNVIGFRGMKWKNADVNIVLQHMAGRKAEAMAPINPKLFAVREKDDLLEAKLEEAYWRFEEVREKQRKITFDDMIYLAARYLRRDEAAATRWASRYDWVIVDEFQDINMAQYQVVKVLGKHSRIVTVGDDDQCHPVGTEVRMADGSTKAIEDIRAGDRVASYDPAKSGSLIGGSSASYSRGYTVLDTATRDYDGDLVEIESSGLKTACTPNHRCVVSFDPDNCKGKVAVYLAQKGDWFRVGVAPLFYERSSVGPNTSTMGPNARAKHEGAECWWLLKTFDSKQEAVVYETFLSVKFGIPEAAFMQRNSKLKWPQERIDEFYGMFDDGELRENASKCLAWHGMDISLPFRGGPLERVFSRRGAGFVCFAANVHPHIMRMGHADYQRNENKRYKPTWKPIDSVSRRPYSGPVVSLDVSDSKMFIADGMVTHNSIYSWRGSDSNIFINFCEDVGASSITMEENYRCGEAIAAIANRLIANNAPNRVEKAIQPQRGVLGEVTTEVFPDEDLQAEHVAQQIAKFHQSGTPYEQMSVLYRTLVQSQAVEDALFRHDIPYVVIGGGSFFKRREIAALLGYLKASTDKHDDLAWSRIINVPFRYLKREVIDEIEYRAGESNWELAVSTTAAKAPIRVGTALRGLLRAVSGVRARQSTHDKLQHVVSATGFIGWLEDEEGKGSASGEDDRVAAVRRLLAMSQHYPDVRHFFDHIRTIEIARAKAAKDKAGKVQLMSCHASKGTEFDRVFFIGVNENIIPHPKSGNEEEERRLAYVAVTRARDGIHISWTMKEEPSRFLKEMGLL